VSNSSSSSFTCDISGRTESGWDMGLGDAEMVESKWGTYSESYLLKDFDEIEEEMEEKEEGSSEDLRYYIPDEYCPLFNLTKILKSDMVNYLVKETGKTIEQIKQEIKDKFADLAKLREYLKT